MGPAVHNPVDLASTLRHSADMGQAQGFDHEVRDNGDVVITHHGQVAAILRGRRAAEFLEEVGADPQLTMARWTGNYKHGNERTAKDHPRNRRGR